MQYYRPDRTEKFARFAPAAITVTNSAGGAAISSDKGKLIRQLSLVAYLMSVGGRKAGTWDIRRNVEGYAGMSDQAFDRRFLADRDELARLGIDIVGDAGEIQAHAGGFPESTLYWLPPENYFLPSVDFSREELAALNSCLWLLEGQFAYGDVLRLALQGLALGSGNPLEDPVTDHINVNLLSTGFDAAAADRLAKIEKAVSQNKTIRFDYQTLGRAEPEERRVDPYSLMLTRGDWYLVGHSRERGGIRVFKLGRIQGKIRNATRAEHDFAVPADFDPRAFEMLEPWQFGQPAGEAVIRLSPRISWQVERSLGQAGTFEAGSDGGGAFRTAYANGASLCDMVLGLGADAVIEQPEELRRCMRERLQRIVGLHTGDFPEPARAETATATIAAAPEPPRQVKPERFVRLSTLVAYLLDRLGDDETAFAPAAEVCSDLGYENLAALQKDLDLLLLVSVDAGGYLVEGYIEDERLRIERCVYGDLLKRPARLSLLEARALLLAIDLVGGYLVKCEHRPLATAREKILKAGGLDEQQSILVTEDQAADAELAAAISRGLDEHRLLEIDFLSEQNGETRKRLIEPYLLTRTRGEWYLVSWCRTAGGERAFRLRMIRQAVLLAETFAPRDIDLDFYRANPALPSGSEAPHEARIYFTPAVARLEAERQPAAQAMADGGIVANVPYFYSGWLVRTVLGYGGEAVVVTPRRARAAVAEAAAGMAARYA